MEEFQQICIALIKFCVGAAISFYLKMSHALHILFWVMLLDQMSGMIAGGIKKELSSSRGWIGLKKKGLMWIMIGVAHLANDVVNVGVDFDSALAIYFIINEVLSVVENCHRCGVRLPPWLESRLVSARDSQNYERLDPKLAKVESEKPNRDF